MKLLHNAILTMNHCILFFSPQGHKMQFKTRRRSLWGVLCTRSWQQFWKFYDRRRRLRSMQEECEGLESAYVELPMRDTRIDKNRSKGFNVKADCCQNEQRECYVILRAMSSAFDCRCVEASETSEAERTSTEEDWKHPREELPQTVSLHLLKKLFSILFFKCKSKSIAFFTKEFNSIFGFLLSSSFHWVRFNGCNKFASDFISVSNSICNNLIDGNQTITHPQFSRYELLLHIIMHSALS
jgi:hypothetical protein